MKYKYLRDPLFLACLIVYSLNRWLFKPFLPNAFSQCYLNDLICIPFWVPIMLFMTRQCGFRDHDGPPTSYEIVVPLILWSAVFEIWLPQYGPFKGLAIADHFDIIFYTLGALVATLFWKAWYGSARHATREFDGQRVADAGVASPKAALPDTNITTS